MSTSVMSSDISRFVYVCLKHDMLVVSHLASGIWHLGGDFPFLWKNSTFLLDGIKSESVTRIPMSLVNESWDLKIGKMRILSVKYLWYSLCPENYWKRRWRKENSLVQLRWEVLVSHEFDSTLNTKR